MCDFSSSNDNDTYADVYSEIPANSVCDSTAQHTTVLSSTHPDVIARLNSVRSSRSELDDTLPRNIPAHEVANVVVQRALERKRKHTSRKSKFHKISSFWRNKTASAHSKSSRNSDKNASTSQQQQQKQVSKSIELYAQPKMKEIQ